MTLPGPTATILHSAPSGLNGLPCWSPDDAYVAMSLNGGAIVVAKADGSSSSSLSGPKDVRLIAWQP